jgi:hypothetical protein
MSNDAEIVEAYSRIAVKEADDGYATHGMSHVNRVIDNCVEISRLLGVDDNDISAIKIAALLHDIGCLDGGKKEHDKRSAEWAKKYLLNKNIPESVLIKIVAAISEHSKDAKSVYGKILLFSDKIDIHHERILPKGLAIIGNRQYSHIKSAKLAVENAVLIVDFLTDGKIDIAEMNHYYFTKKVYHGIADLAQCFGLNYDIMIDGASSQNKH